MVFIEINKLKNNIKLIDKLNKHLSNRKDKIFMLIFMEGCGPCNQTIPEWSKLKNVFSNDFLNKENIIIVSLNKDLIDKFPNVKEAYAFPTIRFITNAGEKVENYEDSEIENKDRTIDSFVEWIKLKSGENNILKNESNMNGGFNIKSKNIKSIKKKRKQKRKWSRKYKKTINCKKPKGFSQKQYCKYGKKY